MLWEEFLLDNKIFLIIQEPFWWEDVEVIYNVLGKSLYFFQLNHIAYQKRKKCRRHLQFLIIISVNREFYQTHMLELVLQYCKQCRPFALLRSVVERMLWCGLRYLFRRTIILRVLTHIVYFVTQISFLIAFLWSMRCWWVKKKWAICCVWVSMFN